MQQFRGGLVSKAQGRCVSLNSRLESNNEEEEKICRMALLIVLIQHNHAAPAGRVKSSIEHPILGCSRHTQTSCTSEVSLRRTGVRSTCGPMSPSSGRDCVKSLRLSYTGLYPQSPAVCARAIVANVGRLLACLSDHLLVLFEPQKGS